MPSGSHRGSRGSHSSGGSRLGGSRSSFGGGSRHIGGSHHHHSTIFMHHGHPRRFRWGHRYYVYSSGSQSILTLFIVLIFFAIMVIFAQSTMINSYKHDMTLIEEDYRYYQDLIANAEDRREEG